VKFFTLIIIIFVLSFKIKAQITINSGTSIRVLSGTVINLAESNTQNLTIQAGADIINDGAIILGNNINLNEGPRWTISGNGTLTATRNINAPVSLLNFAGLGLFISTAQTLGNTTITRGHTLQTGNGNQSIRRYYDVNANNNSSLNANIDFTYNDSTELNGINESTLQIFRSLNAGVSWPLQTGIVNPSIDRVAASGLNNINGKYTLASSNSPLPVNLISYNIQCESDNAFMVWETAREINNSFFKIQASKDLINWEDFEIINVTDVNTNTIKKYQINLSNKIKSGFTYFRLTQQDLDGKTTIFKYLAANCENRNDEFDITVYPNPFEEQIKFQIHSKNVVEIFVFDAIGKIVFCKTLAGDAAYIYPNELNSGIYYLVANNGIEQKSLKIIKQ